MAISFHAADVQFTVLHKRILKAWIQSCVSAEKLICGDISIILCSDEYLLSMNQTHLKHDYYTDIITFNYNTNVISGDLFISVDRVKENASKNLVTPQNELYRVIIHGVMHLCGYNDKKISEQKEMRNQEEKCLKKLDKILRDSVSRGT